MYYYKHHIGDFKRDTDMLTDHQSMVYLRLLWNYYDTEEPLPNDTRKLAFMCRSDQETVALILEHFFTLEDGHWKQERCDQEISQYRSKSEKAKQSASKRWGASAMRTQSDRNANASVSNANASKSDANHKPLTINQEVLEIGKKTEQKKPTRFTPPTLDDVAQYCKERGNTINAQRFIDFYESKGWMVGTSKMKNWKAAVRTWEGKQQEQEPVRKRRML